MSITGYSNKYVNSVNGRASGQTNLVARLHHLPCDSLHDDDVNGRKVPCELEKVSMQHEVPGQGLMT